MFRKAVPEDLDAIAALYDAIHTEEEAGRAVIGWIRTVYPTRESARRAIEAEDLFILEEGGKLVACGRINQEQVDCYKDGSWRCDAAPEEVMVLHTLVVAPDASRSGHGSGFLRFYEAYAAEHGCPYLRLDTNEKNTRARAFYQKHGYTQAGLVCCEFNGIPDVTLVLLEKKL